MIFMRVRARLCGLGRVRAEAVSGSLKERRVMATRRAVG